MKKNRERERETGREREKQGEREELVKKNFLEVGEGKSGNENSRDE